MDKEGRLSKEKEELIRDIQDLGNAATSDLMHLREQMINEVNGLMDYLAEDLIKLQIKMQKEFGE